MKKRHGSVICRGAFCDGMGCILHHPLCGWFPFFCGRRQRGDFASADTRRWTEAVCQLSDRPPSAPTYELVSFPTLAGRGGSVSRRDHTQAYRRPPPLSGGTNSKGSSHPKRQPLFGRGGLGERRFSQRSRLSPQRPPPPVSSGREREGGELLYREAPLPRNTLHFILLPLSSSCRSGRETLLAERRRL